MGFSKSRNAFSYLLWVTVAALVAVTVLSVSSGSLFKNTAVEKGDDFESFDELDDAAQEPLQARKGPKYAIADIKDKSVYTFLPNHKKFTKTANKKNVKGTVFEAFEDTRPMYKCVDAAKATSKDNPTCKERTVVSWKRIVVITGMEPIERHYKTDEKDSRRIKRDEIKFRCMYAVGNGTKTVEGSLRIFDTHGRHREDMHMILCPLGRNETTPDSVKIVMDAPVQAPLLEMRVTREVQKGEKNRVEACIAPIFGDISENLIEWIEYHKALGVKHFYFYDNAATSNTRQIIQYYAREQPDLVTVTNWNAVIKGSSQYYHGQYIYLQHCYHRARSSAKYVMFFDVDEFLRIERGSNVDELVDYIETRYSLDSKGEESEVKPFRYQDVEKGHNSVYIFGHWMFRNTCSPRPETKEEINTKHPVNLVTQRVHWKGAVPMGFNNKFFANSEEALWISLSVVGENMNGEDKTGMVFLDSSEGYFHHYRSSDKVDSGPCTFKRNYIQDNFMVKYAGPLQKAVSETSLDIWGESV